MREAGGLPALEALAQQQDADEGGTAAQDELKRRLAAFAALYPPAPRDPNPLSAAPKTGAQKGAQ